MDKKIQILLGSEKNINSVNVDNYDKVELFNNVSDLMDYDVNDAVSEAEVFDAEREANPIYRIYGRMEYMSLLNNITSKYTKFSDFLTPQFTGDTKNIFNSFDFYLVRPAFSGYTKINGMTGSVSGSSTISIIDEKFDTWVTASPSNYPLGWGVTVSAGSYITQAPTNKAKFFFDSNFLFTTPFNLITLYQDIPYTYGDIVIETNISSISPSYDPINDLLSVWLSNSGTLVTTIPLLTGGVGHKKITVSLPISSGFTRVAIFGNAGTNKSIYLDYFKMYITGNTTVVGGGSTVTLNPYVRYYEVIATPKDFELFNAGFSNNSYGEQIYTFNFKKDYDVSKYFDNFNFPATELFLYAKYKPVTIGVPAAEKLQYSYWGTIGIPVPTLLSTTALNIGDKVYGDIITYDKEEFTQTQVSGQTYFISTTCKNSQNVTITLVWKYDPFTSLRLCYFSNELSSANTGTTSYDIQVSIPAYATPIDGDGNVVWREIQAQGYTDPLTGVGVDYPFINKKRYLFSKIILSVVPDLTNPATKLAFNNIWFTKSPSALNILPNSDLNNIGKPCQ